MLVITIWKNAKMQNCLDVTILNNLCDAASFLTEIWDMKYEIWELFPLSLIILYTWGISPLFRQWPQDATICPRRLWSLENVCTFLGSGIQVKGTSDISAKKSLCLDMQCHNSCSSIITSHRETALFSKVLHQELFTYPVENFFYSAQLHKRNRYRSKEVSLSKECDATII